MTTASTPLRILVTILVFNEGEKLAALLSRFPELRSYDLLLVDDGSTDRTPEVIRASGFPTIRHQHNEGVGSGLRDAISHARRTGYDVLVVMAGNGKMDPAEIERLLTPIQEGRADYVQGSRYLDGGSSPNLPTFRHVGIRLFTLLANAILGFRGSDVTCGFRAYRLAILDRPDIDLSQAWLNKYEMEYYIHYKAVRGGVRVCEVPISMVYPAGGGDYSKIRPIVGWWSMLRPWIFLTLGLRK